MKGDHHALSLQSAGLYRAAENVAATNLAAAERAGSADDVVAAHVRLLSIALDCDRPRRALRWGTPALPLTLGSRPVSPALRTRLFVNLAKASWLVGMDRDFLAYVDAAAATVDHEALPSSVVLHYRTVKSAAAYMQGDWQAARALSYSALDLAAQAGDPSMERRCRLNLGWVALLSGALDEAEAWVRTVLESPWVGTDRIEALGDGVRTALAVGDVELAGVRLRALLAGYLEAPSRLSPLAFGFLSDAIGSYYHRRGLPEAAGALWSLAAAWFAKCGHEREVERVRRQVAEVRHGFETPRPVIDPDLVYLGRLFAAAWQGEAQDGDFQVAVAVNRLLPSIAPGAAPVATEHAAMLRPVGPIAALLMARSEAGRAAVRVLTGEDEAARAALDVISAYERLCGAGLSWPLVTRSLQGAGLAHGPVRALDRLYQELVA